MGGVKSFRIDDLLVEKDNLEERSNSKTCLVEKCDKSNLKCREISEQSYSPREKAGKLSPDNSLSENGPFKNETVKTSRLEERGYGNAPGGASFPFNGVPMILPFGANQFAGRSHNFPNMIPNPFDASRLKSNGRSIFGGQHSDSNPLLSQFSPYFNGHFPPGMEFLSFPNFVGHFGVPLVGNMGDPLHEKRHFINDRIHYPLYPLGRSVYTSNCKRKGGQIRFNNSQTAQLEKAFVQQKYLNANDRKKLAQSLGLSDRQVKTWFQNRRAKLRKCKGGICVESEVSGSPEDSRTVSPLDNSPIDMKNDD